MVAPYHKAPLKAQLTLSSLKIKLFCRIWGGDSYPSSPALSIMSSVACAPLQIIVPVK